MKRKNAVWIGFICLVLPWLSGCASRGLMGSMPHGVVVEAESGRAIADAYVLAEYIGDGPYAWPDPGATARDRCYGTLIARTEPEGRFDFGPLYPKRPMTHQYTRNQYVRVTAYKPGYTYERVDGYDHVNKREFVFVKYERATGMPTRLSMVNADQSAFRSRDEYIARLLGYCGDFSPSHWEMTKTMLEEEEAWASTIRQWRHALAVCKYLNKENANYTLGRDDVDCMIYERKIQEVETQKFLGAKSAIDNIDWGTGPRLKLLEYSNPEYKSTIVFDITPSLKKIDEKSVIKYLSGLCKAGLQIEQDDICFLNGNGSSRWHAGRWSECDAAYAGTWPSQYGAVYLRQNSLMKKVMTLDANWCEEADK